jgi:hypothetical protein|tara:strand:+ start:3515 stop:3820 length:306 start_codon:yes stop_codon:yes gene_type:complete
VDRGFIYVGKALSITKKEEGWLKMSSAPHTLTHSFSAFTHSFLKVNKGSELGFYRLSTVFTSSYYYYLYIYKSRSQADLFQIRVRSEKTQYKNNMSVRATA